MHKSVTVTGLTEKGNKAIKKQFKEYKKYNKAEQIVGRGAGISVEIISEDPWAIKTHFRGMAAKITKMNHVCWEIESNMTEHELTKDIDYKIEVEE